MLEQPTWEIKRTIYTRAEENFSTSLGLPPEERNLQQKLKRGVVVVDKVPGPTSHEVVAWVKKLMDLDHVGHGGTLDPKVTGVLPVTVEASTKCVQALLDSGKEYVTIMRTHEDVEEKKLLPILKEFEGEIFQRPPLRSAVSRRLRTRYIYRIEYLGGGAGTGSSRSTARAAHTSGSSAPMSARSSAAAHTCTSSAGRAAAHSPRTKR